MKKILVFISKELSYSSSAYFMRRIADAVEENGICTKVCELGDIEQSEELLMELLKEDYIAVFDMNSSLPAVTIDERHYLDLFNAPFYDFLVDHPLHLHTTLGQKINNYNVVCLDKAHAEYIRNIYKHIRNVYVMGFAGSYANSGSSALSEDKYTVLFPATYTPLSYYHDLLETAGPFYTSVAQRILDIYTSDDEVHEFFDAYMEASGSDENLIGVKLFKARYVERYIRQYYRDKILDAILSSGIVVDTIGMRWEMYNGSAKENIVSHGAKSYAETIDMIACSKIVLNVQPLFMDAAHDRVLNAMINRSVCITDRCDFISREFDEYICGDETINETNNKIINKQEQIKSINNSCGIDNKKTLTDYDLITFNRNHPERMIPVLKELIGDTGLTDRISDNAFEKVSQNHTWKKHIQNLLKEMEIM